MVLIEIKENEELLKQFKFPSPYGDYGSYQALQVLTKSHLKKFPSPYGDYGSYLKTLLQVRQMTTKSFRPLTGIMVLINLEKECIWKV